MVVYYCDHCGDNIDFKGQTSTVCQTCGAKNVDVEAEKAAFEAKAKVEKWLGDIEALEDRLKASGDAEARDYIFRKDFQPRIDILFENLIENFEDYFQRPIFQIDLLKKYNSSFDVEKVFERENQKGFTPNFTSELLGFTNHQMGLPVMNLLAAAESSKTHIQILKAHAMFLSDLYNIRGETLDLKPASLQIIENLINKAKNNCEELVQLYPHEGESGRLNSVLFQAWRDRLDLNFEIVNIFNHCFQKQYDQIIKDFDRLKEFVETQIKLYKEKNEQEPENYPLYLVTAIIGGFSKDQEIIQFLEKIVKTIVQTDIQMEFIDFLEALEKYTAIADTAFDGVKMPDWDPKWIETLEDSFDRLFNLIDNLTNYLNIIKKKEMILLLEPDIDLEAWQANKIIDPKELDKDYFRIRDFMHITSRIKILIPIAAVSTYAILKTGFIRKEGDEFESFLLVNPFFRLDPRVNYYLYPRAFSYIDIAETLKESDPLRIKLSQIEEMVEKNARTYFPTADKALPIIVTPKEIEEFVQKTYDLFEMTKEGGKEPVRDFNRNYKMVGITKKLEKLSGELIDFIYVPGLLMKLAFGKLAKDGKFVPIGEYKWKLLIPYNNNPTNPWDNFLNMIIEPHSFTTLINQMDEIH